MLCVRLKVSGNKHIVLPVDMPNDGELGVDRCRKRFKCPAKSERDQGLFPAEGRNLEAGRVDLVVRQDATEQPSPSAQIGDLCFRRRETQLFSLIGDGLNPRAINDVLESTLNGARIESVLAKQADDLTGG